MDKDAGLREEMLTDSLEGVQAALRRLEQTSQVMSLMFLSEEGTPQRLLPESRGKNLALTGLYVLYSLQGVKAALCRLGQTSQVSSPTCLASGSLNKL